MKAIVQDRFGPPDSLRFSDVDVPGVGPGDVLVRVRAASLNPYDWHMLRGDPRVARLFGVGFRRPRSRIAGIDVAGEVAAVGPEVRDLRPGDAVFGFCKGSFAEYAAGPATTLVPKPAGLDFAEAAALPMAATTALRGLRDVGGVRPRHRVLINGAGGGVGTFAVQLAVALGADVTGVCSARNVDLVRSLGAGQVIDYAREDFADGRGPYDVLLDNVGNRPLRQLRRALTPDGTYVANFGGSPGKVFGAVGVLPRVLLTNLVVRQRLRVLQTTLERDELVTVAEHVAAGRLRPVVDRTYPLADVAAGLRLLEEGHARGKYVVTVP